MSNLMTQAAYAESRGVSKQAIGDLVRRGIITLIDGKIDPSYADHQRAQSLNPAKSKSLQAQGIAPSQASPGQSGSNVTQMSEYQAERAARERIERMTAELEYQRKVGASIDRAGVLKGLKEAGSSLRDQLMSVPRRVAAEIAGCNDVRVAEKRLEDELRQVLKDFAASLIAKLEAEQSDG